MRFMLIVKADRNKDAGFLPTKELVAAMMKYNEEMIREGVMLSAEGLHATSRGARVSFSGESIMVTHGPFADGTKLIAGFWIIQVKSLEEAIQWAKRWPAPTTGGETELELRQVFEQGNFPSAILAGEAAAHEPAMRAEVRGAAA